MPLTPTLISTLTTNNSISEMMLKINEIIYNFNDLGEARTYYVSTDGSDTLGVGTVNSPFATIKHACEEVAAQCGGVSTLVKITSGTYFEQLPIIIPPNCAIVGDSIRSTFVQPKVGNLSDDGVNNNENSTMFLMSNGSFARNLAMRGMTGWVKDPLNPSDVSGTTPRGIGFALNPASPIFSVSPYINDCSAFFTGGIGIYVDGYSNLLGNKSMLCHAYTNLNNDGVGYWADNGGKLEIVSCFTYYSHFHYVASNGGQIRSLNGSNSWGNYGASAVGYLPEEIPIYGNVYGSQLLISAKTGLWNVGSTITDSFGATGTILYVGEDRILYKSTAGTFVINESITNSDGGVAIIENLVDAVGGQSGRILIASGFSVKPEASGSIELVGDGTSYVIQKVIGDYVNSSSVLEIHLIQLKTTSSVDGVGIVVRYKNSQIRLTGHDFLNIGTGNVISTNLPNLPLTPPVQENEINEIFPGRIFFISTDQVGNFRVGDYFNIDQGTGIVAFNSTELSMTGVVSLEVLVANGNITTSSDLWVNGGDMDTTSNTFNLLNNAADINFGGSANTIYISSDIGTVYTKNDLEVLGRIHVVEDVLASSNVTISNNLTVNQNTLIFGTTTANGDVTFNNDFHVFGDTKLDGTLEIDGGLISSNNTIFNFLPSPLEVNIGLGANLVNIGSATSNTVISDDLRVIGDIYISGEELNSTTTNFNLLGTPTNIINFGSSANVINIGAVATGNTTIRNNSILQGTLIVANDSTFSSNVAIQGGSLNTTSETFNIFPSTSFINIGDANTGLTVIRNNTQIDGTLHVIKDVTINGDLIVNGITTTIDTENLFVKDKNIEMGVVSIPSNITADGGGITLKGLTDKTIIWDLSNSNWTSSENWNLVSTKTYKINNVEVLSSTSLGSTVVGSSLTSVGTITSGHWSADTIEISRGGTNITSFTKGDILYASANNVLFKLPIGELDQLLQVTADGLIHWIQNLDAGDY